ncbi:MAG TPA: RsmB/NOP family class I SAM-dependent RNA methyltransferase, partial [Candidatus Binatus sp.]|nr:RsmB/NOP family class I SAM-dependent RNA methyltransferase [Candidatus Binatus sp.]
MFRLVMDTLSRKSLIDRVIGLVLGKTPTDKEKLNISRLAVLLLLLVVTVDKRQALDALRRNCPVGFQTQLEKLVGEIVADNRLDSYLSGTQENERTALMLGYPEWWVEYCIRVWGRGEALRLLGNRARPRYLHLNPLRSTGTPESQLLMLPGLEPATSLPGFFRVLTEGLPGQVREYVENGILEGQDLASYLAVKAGSPTEKDAVLDVCTAPGAKTGALSQLMNNTGTIVSADYSRRRIRDWKRMVAMLGVENASGVVEDMTRPALKKESMFDLILVDPPCSGSGIFDKNPEMRWHISPQRLARNAELQYRLLQESSKFLNQGGRMVYSTCSISVEE